MELICLTEEYKRLLFEISLFDNISLNLKDNFIENVDYSLYKIYKNDVVARQDTYCKHLMVLLKGRLRVDSIDNFGNEILIEYIASPHAFATPYLFNTTKKLPATFKSDDEGVLLMANADSFFSFLSKTPSLLKNFLSVVNNCTKCSSHRLRILSHKNMKSRFVAYLFEQQVDDDIIVNMDHNQVELADYLGVTRPALAREIGKMAKDGLLSIKGKRVELLKISELKKCIM